MNAATNISEMRIGINIAKPKKWPESNSVNPLNDRYRGP